MAIGIDDIDFEDEITTTQNTDESPMDDTLTEQQTVDDLDDSTDELSDRDVLERYLQSKGIEDLSKIKYEDEEGEEIEKDWDSLEGVDKLNILNSVQSNNPLDPSEMELISAIRNSRMSPREYLDYVAQTSINQYAQQETIPTYQIDQYSDDELFVADLISRVGENNLTETEIQEALDKAKSNETLFNKQVAAIRNEYQQAERNDQQYQMQLQQQQQQAEYNQFANTIQQQIMNFNDFNGFDLNMDQDDKAELYDFIVGQDDAGRSIMGKALNDPEILVKMAWFALHGEQMLDDISDYVKQSVTKVRRESYNKGVSDARAGTVKSTDKKPVTVFKSKKSNKGQISIDDLDI